jgi:hypothetical protein
MGMKKKDDRNRAAQWGKAEREEDKRGRKVENDKENEKVDDESENKYEEKIKKAF